MQNRPCKNVGNWPFEIKIHVRKKNEGKLAILPQKEFNKAIKANKGQTANQVLILS
jgi:hypothetical protein